MARLLTQMGIWDKLDRGFSHAAMTIAWEPAP